MARRAEGLEVRVLDAEVLEHTVSEAAAARTPGEDEEVGNGGGEGEHHEKIDGALTLHADHDLGEADGGGNHAYREGDDEGRHHLIVGHEKAHFAKLLIHERELAFGLHSNTHVKHVHAGSCEPGKDGFLEGRGLGRVWIHRLDIAGRGLDAEGALIDQTGDGGLDGELAATLKIGDLVGIKRGGGLVWTGQAHPVAEGQTRYQNENVKEGEEGEEIGSCIVEGALRVTAGLGATEGYEDGDDRPEPG